MRRACYYRQNKSDDWQFGWLLGWSGLSEWPNAIIETEEGEVILMRLSRTLPVDFDAGHEGYIEFVGGVSGEETTKMKDQVWLAGTYDGSNDEFVLLAAYTNEAAAKADAQSRGTDEVKVYELSLDPPTPQPATWSVWYYATDPEMITASLINGRCTGKEGAWVASDVTWNHLERQAIVFATSRNEAIARAQELWSVYEHEEAK